MLPTLTFSAKVCTELCECENKMTALAVCACVRACLCTGASGRVAQSRRAHSLACGLSKSPCQRLQSSNTGAGAMAAC